MQTGSQPDADLTQTPSPPSPADSKPTQRDLAQTPSQPIDADDDQSHDDDQIGQDGPKMRPKMGQRWKEGWSQ